MKNQDIENKLTPAARRALDDFVDEYRQQILLEAEKSATSPTGDIQEISVKDVLSGAERRRDAKQNRQLLIQRVLRLYSVIGIIMIFFSVFYYLYKFTPFLQDSVSTVIFAIGFTGAILALSPTLFGFLFPRLSDSTGANNLKQSTSDNASAASVEFIIRWRDIELEARNLMAAKLGESNATEPISRVFVRLEKEDILDKVDLEKLRNLLDIRNKIAHSGLNLPRSEVNIYIKDANQIIEKMKALSNAV